MTEPRKANYVHKKPGYVQSKQQVERAAAAVRGIQQVTDEASAVAASEALVVASKTVKAVAKARLEVSAPYRRSTETINEEFKELVSPLEGAEKALKDQLMQYEEKVEAERRKVQAEHEEATRKAEEAARKAEEEAQRQAAEAEAKAKAAEEAGQEPEPSPAPESPPPLPPPPPPPPPVVPPRVRHTGKGSVSARIVKKHEVFDESQLPREYLIKNPSAIKRAIDDGVDSIPGVRIWEEKVAHVR